VLSVFTHKLTPGSRLPFALDDMINNNLGSTQEFANNLQAVHRVSNTKFESAVAIEQYLTQELSWVNLKSIMTIAASAMKVEEHRVESHYVFQASVEEAVFKYALINAVKTETGIKIVISQETRKAFGIRKNTIYHDVRSSPFGLPFDSETVLTNSNDDKKEFHDFNRNKLMAGLKIIRGTQNTQLLSFNIGSVISSATSAVTGLCDAWKSITSAFKTVNSETLKDKITGEGFKKYRSTSRYIRSLGIPTDSFDKYMGSYVKLIGADKNIKIKDEFLLAIELGQWVPSNDWGANDFTFDINTGGTCNSVVVLTRNDEEDRRMHIITTVVDGSFQLAPNIFIYEKVKSVAGGIVENTSVVMKEVPRSITENDIKGIHAMMLVTGLQVMADNFGVPFKLPDSAFQK